MTISEQDAIELIRAIEQMASERQQTTEERYLAEKILDALHMGREMEDPERPNATTLGFLMGTLSAFAFNESQQDLNEAMALIGEIADVSIDDVLISNSGERGVRSLSNELASLDDDEIQLRKFATQHIPFEPNEFEAGREPPRGNPTPGGMEP